MHNRMNFSLSLSLSLQNIHFDDFKHALIIDDEEEKDEGMVDEEEQEDTTPWAGSNRDYSYEEVGVVSCGGQYLGC